ncbi:hypothetical protein LCGC14_0784540 [marine sediment metagenome]|uniref:Uncharacterized protein n=1 Tax=marine sediment metagenome TaxID=412755 RepID=A0A0F9PUS4_9ZZZZ|nr:hypothetical protein [Phycisphaerae bacterium]
MAGKSEGKGSTRIAALENSHRDLHAKMDQIVAALGGGAEVGSGIVPGTFDAYGRPVVAMLNQAHNNPANGNAETLRLLLPLVAKAQQQPRSFDWAPVMIAILPPLIERLFDRPDPIEQIAAMKELIDPGMGEQLMGMMAPLMMAKMAGGPGGAMGAMPAPAPTKKGEPDAAEAAKAKDMHDQLQQALDSLDPATLAAFAESQAPANGEARAS